jgi:hypothetical protein
VLAPPKILAAVLVGEAVVVVVVVKKPENFCHVFNNNSTRRDPNSQTSDSILKI